MATDGQSMTVKVTKPDGTTETLGPFTSDDTGGTHTQFTPTELGTYTFQMSYPGETLTGGSGYAGSANQARAAEGLPLIAGAPGDINNPIYVGDYHEPAISNIATMTVQQQPVGGVSVAPLPTTYWQTPITAMNVNNWYAIGGASLSLGPGTVSGGPDGKYNNSANYNPYTTAPTTSSHYVDKAKDFRRSTRRRLRRNNNLWQLLLYLSVRTQI